MKKISLISMCLIIFYSELLAQVTKQSWLVGGNANYSHHRYEAVVSGPTSYYTIQIQPKVGIFFINKLATGILADWSLLKYEYKSTSLSIGPFLRYYLLPGNSKVNIFGEANFQYGYTKLVDERLKIHGHSLLAGPVLFINQNVGLEFTVGYSKSKTVSITEPSSAIKAGIGLQVHLKK